MEMTFSNVIWLVLCLGIVNAPILLLLLCADWRADFSKSPPLV